MCDVHSSVRPVRATSSSPSLSLSFSSSHKHKYAYYFIFKVMTFRFFNVSQQSAIHLLSGSDCWKWLTCCMFVSTQWSQRSLKRKWLQWDLKRTDTARGTSSPAPRLEFPCQTLPGFGSRVTPTLTLQSKSTTLKVTLYDFDSDLNRRWKMKHT